HTAALRDLFTLDALITGNKIDSVWAADTFCEDASRRGLSGSAGASEKQRMMKPPCAESITQGLSDMILAHQLAKTLGAPFSCNYLIGQSLDPYLGANLHRPHIGMRN